MMGSVTAMGLHSLLQRGSPLLENWGYQAIIHLNGNKKRFISCTMLILRIAGLESLLFQQSTQATKLEGMAHEAYH